MPSAQGFWQEVDDIISDMPPTPELPPIEDLIFPKKDPRLCRTMSTGRLETVIQVNLVQLGHSRNFSGDTMVSEDTEKTNTSTSFVESISGEVQDLKREVELKDELLQQTISVTQKLQSENDDLKQKLENIDFKREIEFKDGLLQQTISVTQKLQSEYDDLKQQVENMDCGTTDAPSATEEYLQKENARWFAIISSMQNVGQAGQITALKQQLHAKDIEFASAKDEVNNLKSELDEVKNQNRMMTETFADNQRGFDDQFARMTHIQEYMENDPSNTPDAHRDLEYKDKLYSELEKRSADCAGELRKVKMQRVLEQDNSSRKIVHLEAELKSVEMALQKMASRKEKYRMSNEEILSMLKQRLTQNNIVKAISDYFDEVRADNASLCASSEELELELIHRRGQVYDLTEACYRSDQQSEEQKERFDSLEQEKSAAENKVVELEIQRDFVSQEHGEFVTDKDAEIADLNETIAQGEEYIKHLQSTTANERQAVVLRHKDHIIRQQRTELIEVKKLTATLKQQTAEQYYIDQRNAQFAYLAERKDKMRQKRVENLTNEVDTLRQLVTVKDGTADMNEVLDEIEALKMIKHRREDWIGELANLAIKFLLHVHMLEDQLESAGIEVDKEGRAELIQACRKGLSYQGVRLTEDEKIFTRNYEDDWDDEYIKDQENQDASNGDDTVVDHSWDNAWCDDGTGNIDTSNDTSDGLPPAPLPTPQISYPDQDHNRRPNETRSQRSIRLKEENLGLLFQHDAEGKCIGVETPHNQAAKKANKENKKEMGTVDWIDDLFSKKETEEGAAGPAGPARQKFEERKVFLL